MRLVIPIKRFVTGKASRVGKLLKKFRGSSALGSNCAKVSF